MGTRGLGFARMVVVGLCVFCGSLAFASIPALAFTEYPAAPSGHFGGNGSGNGQFEGANSIAASASTGDVYVTDENRHVQYFSSTGTYIGQFNGVGAPGGQFSSTQGVAVDNSANPLDPSAGDVYVADPDGDVIDEFTSTGAFVSQITETPKGPLGKVNALFTDPSGDLWAAYGNTVVEFSDTGSFVKEVTLNASREKDLAVDSRGFIYTVNSFEVLKFSATGELILTQDSEAHSVTVDTSTNNVFVNAEAENIEEYGPFDEPLATPVQIFGTSGAIGGSFELRNMTVLYGPEPKFYALARTIVYFFDGVNKTAPAVTVEPPAVVGENDATLSGTVNPEGSLVSRCEFEYETTETKTWHPVACASNPGSGSEVVSVSAQVSGLSPGTTYPVRLVAENALGTTTAVGTFITEGPPVVVGESFSAVGSSSVTLHAVVSAGGQPSTYSFEYGPSGTYGFTTPPESFGAGHASVSALASVGALQAETEYDFRVVATNASGTVRGENQRFSTLAAGTLGLPDGRGFEMVSPLVNSDGNVYEPDGLIVANGSYAENTELPYEASVDGNAVAYVADPPATGGNGSVGKENGNEYVAVRAPGGGWSATDVEPSGVVARYQAFSGDLSVGFFDAATASGLSAGAPGGNYHVLYSRVNREGTLSALLTANPSHRIPATFRTVGTVSENVHPEVAYAGSSSDLNHSLFEANDALTENAMDGGAGENSLYDSVGGRLYLVNVLPDGMAAPNASFGAPSSGNTGGAVTPPDFSHVISADGSRVFWTDLSTGNLYVRENDTQPQSPLDGTGRCTVSSDACTVQVDASQGGAGPSGGGSFWTASGDGSRVFFTDCNRLTADSTAVSAGGCGHIQDSGEGLKGNDLYEFDVMSGRLTDLTVDKNADPLGASVQGVIGTSEDGEYVYFVADDVLAPGAPGGDCSKGETNSTVGCDLYLRHDGVTRFIATLGAYDNSVGEGGFASEGDWQSSLGFRTAEVTPDGHSVVFMSRHSLTGYVSNGFAEVYVYDSGMATLSCASCNPSGGPPTGTLNAKVNTAAYLPLSYSNTYLRRWISTDGSRVFFDSLEALVPQDTNGWMDVYEWERAGAGSCKRAGGCVYLLSGGTNADNSFLLDASATGDDVFIVTRAQLVSQDQNDNFDVYDASVGAPQPPSPPACSGSGCQGVPGAPPIFATPSSVTFSGVGNFPPPPTGVVRPKGKVLTRAQKLARALRACRTKHGRHERAVCKARAMKRYGSSAATARKSGARGGK